MAEIVELEQYTWPARGLHRTMVIESNFYLLPRKKKKKIDGTNCMLPKVRARQQGHQNGRRCDKENELRDDALLVLLGWIHRNVA